MQQCESHTLVRFSFFKVFTFSAKCNYFKQRPIRKGPMRHLRGQGRRKERRKRSCDTHTYINLSEPCLSLAVKHWAADTCLSKWNALRRSEGKCFFCELVPTRDKKASTSLAQRDKSYKPSAGSQGHCCTGRLSIDASSWFALTGDRYCNRQTSSRHIGRT